MQFNRHSGAYLVCIQMSVQIIAIANEPPSAILLILLTRGVNCCCSKATSGVWGHHLIHDPRSNYIHEVKKYFVSLSILWQWFKNYTGLGNELSPR